MRSQSFTTELAGKTLTAEYTDLTNQANGSIMLRYGETVILATATMNDSERDDLPYFPLSVEFEEKFYAAGAILGSRFMRREGRPSDEAVLTARLIDRTIRPLFDHALRREVQVVINVLALGDDDPDVLGVIGASLALAISDIPWHGPVGAVRIARNHDTGAVMINPTYTEREAGVLDFEVFACGQNGSINMIETAAQETSEDDIVAVLEAATLLHAELETFQAQVVAAVGKAKCKITTTPPTDELITFYETKFATRLYETIFSNQTGKRHINALAKEFVAAAITEEVVAVKQVAADFFTVKIDEVLHQGVVQDGRRADGRAADEVRSLFAKAGGLSPVLHGSGIFYRGETHIFTALTLGGPDTVQAIDTIELQAGAKRFMHHYNFPPFSVGETGRVGGFNRRMIGHGALAEKALAPVIPSVETFPYTIRLVSETLASNGSSSMGSVCASTLALLDGGVPITAPVAGIASGVMMMGDAYVLLTDIQGPEDEHGDMDFKVAGTKAGITAIQMDVKVAGIPLHILTEALAAAKAARLEILTTITDCIATPRAHISPRAPHIITLNILPEQIGQVIGGGGKTIKKIKEETGVEDITIEDDGTVFITGRADNSTTAAEYITALTKIYQVGDIHTATITRIVPFGAFAKLDAHHEGLIHISEITTEHLDSAAEVLKVGDEVAVKVLKVADGKIGLSIQQAAATEPIE